MYEHDNQACAEAGRYPLSREQLADLRPLVVAKRTKLGPKGIRGHQVAYNTKNWEALIPHAFAQRGMISRGDVFDLAETGNFMAVFAASLLWGTDDPGYAPYRYREIVASTHGRLPGMLAAAAAACAGDAIAGYAMLFGGHDPKQRAAPNTEPWTRIDGFGPAFFTRFLYFTAPGALILDKVLAKKVSTLSGMPDLVRGNGQSYAWSPYRYAVYLHWMCQTASQLECAPDELEVTLFAPARLS